MLLCFDIKKTVSTCIMHACNYKNQLYTSLMIRMYMYGSFHLHWGFISCKLLCIIIISRSMYAILAELKYITKAASSCILGLPTEREYIAVLVGLYDILRGVTNSPKRVYGNRNL